MPWKSKKAVRLLLTIVIIGTIGGIAAIYLNFELQTEEPEKKDVASPKEANLVIANVRQISKKNGRDEWLLEADSVKYLTAENEAVFDHLSLIFYGKSGEQTYLEADQGVLKTDSKNISVQKNVRIRREEYIMKTESIGYLHQDELLAAKHPVVLSGPRIELTAGAMKMDIQTDRIFFTGGVKGTLKGDIEIRNQFGF